MLTTARESIYRIDSSVQKHYILVTRIQKPTTPALHQRQTAYLVRHELYAKDFISHRYLLFPQLQLVAKCFSTLK